MILYFLLLFFELCSSVNQLPSQNSPTIPKATKPNDTQIIWGILHSIDQFKTWAIRDSEIFALLQLRKEYLKGTQHLTKIHLDKFKKSKKDQNNFSLIFRLTNKLASLKKHFLLTVPPSPTQILNLFKINSQHISSIDLFLSINGLLQPHQFNGLYPYQIANALDIDTTDSHGGHLNLLQSLEIGLFALYRKWYTRSVEWLHFSHNFAINLEKSTYLSKTFIVDLASKLFTLVIQEHNRILIKPETPANYFISINLFSRPIKKRPVSTYPQKINRTSWPSYPPILYSRKTFNRLLPDNEDMQYATLCKDLNYEIYTPYSKLQKNLKCFFEKSIHPYFYINPVKSEHLSDSPPVYLYYDIVKNKLNEELKLRNDIKVEMNRTSKVNRKNMEDRSEIKTSTWKGVGKGEMEGFEGLEWISEKLTGLRISLEETTNESMEYTVYTYGRMVGAHTDVEYDKVIRYGQWEVLRKDGERLATLLYYLQPAYLGGQTAFCQGGFNVVPSKNSLLVYYHLHRNGSVRYDIDHGSCPVLHGSKIVLLAATRYLPNWQSFKCSLNRNE